MHELSIAISIVETCTEELIKAGAKKVSRVELQVGSLSGVEHEALEFSWDVATKASPVEGAELFIHKTEASAICLDCGNEFKIDNLYSTCPACDSFRNNITKGKELLIKALVVE